ncbi:hypothetical protein LguiB_022378 [Lonicera macranthoides]
MSFFAIQSLWVALLLPVFFCSGEKYATNEVIGFEAPLSNSPLPEPVPIVIIPRPPPLPEINAPLPPPSVPDSDKSLPPSPAPVYERSRPLVPAFAPEYFGQPSLSPYSFHDYNGIH